MLKKLPELISEVAGDVRTVDAETALRESRENNGLIIDIREPGEVGIKKAIGTVHIPRGVLEMKLPELCPQHDRPIYLHCASGGRARLAVEQLTRMGYLNVTAISCGIDDICRTLDDA